MNHNKNRAKKQGERWMLHHVALVLQIIEVNYFA